MYTDKPVFFIADLHLDCHEQARIDKFVRFLHWAKGQDASVCVVGDLFNFWVGAAQAWLGPYRRFIKTLRNISRCVPLLFLHGNRDFLFPPVWRRQGGLTLTDGGILERSSVRAILYHGDVFLTNDHGYQSYRKLVQSRWIYFLTCLLPASVCLYVGQRMRRISQGQLKNKQNKNNNTLQIDMRCVCQVLQDSGAEVMICGHYHHEQVLPITLPDRLATMYILPENKELQLRYLRWENGNFCFEDFEENRCDA